MGFVKVAEYWSRKTSPEVTLFPAALTKSRLSRVIKTRLCRHLLNSELPRVDLPSLFSQRPPGHQGGPACYAQVHPRCVLHLTVFWGGRVSSHLITRASGTKTTSAWFPFAPWGALLMRDCTDLPPTPPLVLFRGLWPKKSKSYWPQTKGRGF